MLKRILRKQCVNICNGFRWLWTGINGGICEDDNGHSFCELLKARNFLTSQVIITFSRTLLQQFESESGKQLHDGNRSIEGDLRKGGKHSMCYGTCLT
jgi:hypothetical protein